MSRAFVKEPDGDQVEDDQPELPQSPHPNYVTPTGLAQLRRKHEELEQKRDESKAGGNDLAKKLAQSRIARELRYIEARLQSAKLVDPSRQAHDTVAFGTVVTVADEAGETHEYAIVGEDEADVGHGKVSWVSPLAKALIGGRVGDAVTWLRPAGDTELEITAIRYPNA